MKSHMKIQKVLLLCYIAVLYIGCTSTNSNSTNESTLPFFTGTGGS